MPCVRPAPTSWPAHHREYALTFDAARGIHH
jgi:hypothetical protein